MKFISNTFFHALATLISRILGYIRDAVIASIFGANQLTDAFFVAWKLPNTFRQLLAEGSFSAAFIPTFTDLRKKSEKEALRYASSLFSVYTLVLAILTFVVIMFAPYIVTVLAPGFVNKGNFEKTVELIRIVFPYLILIGWVSFFTGMLNTKNRFFIPAVSPALLNLSFIFFALFLSNYYGIYALAYGALVGGVLQVLLQIPLLIKEKLIIKPSFSTHPELKKTFKKMLPAFASFGVNQFSFFIDTIIASLLLSGAISYLYYGNRIFQLPIGLFAVGIGNALLVSLSAYSAKKQFDKFDEDFNTGLKLALFISVPATFGILVLGIEMIDLLFAHGSFGKTETYYTFQALAGYGVGLPFIALSRPFKSAFFAVEDMKTPLYATIAGVVVSIGSAILFGFVFGLGVLGLSLATSIGALVTLVYLYFYYDFTVRFKEVSITGIKVVIASILMFLYILGLKLFIYSSFLLVLIGISGGIVVYVISLYILKEDMLILFLSVLKRKFKR